MSPPVGAIQFVCLFYVMSCHVDQCFMAEGTFLYEGKSVPMKRGQRLFFGTASHRKTTMGREISGPEYNVN